MVIASLRPQGESVPAVTVGAVGPDLVEHAADDRPLLPLLGERGCAWALSR
jgi:hypothetical protein